MATYWRAVMCWGAREWKKHRSEILFNGIFFALLMGLLCIPGTLTLLDYARIRFRQEVVGARHTITDASQGIATRWQAWWQQVEETVAEDRRARPQKRR